jgi:ActR/RegA family two-component response regulator
MWKYLAASFLVLVGVIEIILALNARMREAIMQNSALRSKRSEPLVLLLAGLSAIATALGIIFYGLYR